MQATRGDGGLGSARLVSLCDRALDFETVASVRLAEFAGEHSAARTFEANGGKIIALQGQNPANLKVGDSATDGACARIHAALERAGVDVLYDDRDERPGAKFATMDLIGLPHQILVGPRSLGEGKVELKERRGGARELVSVEDAIQRFGGRE